MLRSLLAIAALTLPVAALADTTMRCDSNGIAVEVSASEKGATTTLTVNGKDVPAVRACMDWFNGNPRIGGRWRCPHGVAGSSVRYEVYPILSPANGEANHVRVIRWDGNRSPVVLDVKDCE